MGLAVNSRRSTRQVREGRRGVQAQFPAPGKLPPPASDATANSTAPAWLEEPAYELKPATKGARKLQRKLTAARAVKERTDFRVLAKCKPVSPRRPHPT